MLSHMSMSADKVEYDILYSVIEWQHMNGSSVFF